MAGERVVAALLIAGGALVFGSAILLWAAGRLLPTAALIAVPGVAVVLGLAATWWQRPTPGAVAGRLDRAAPTGDRFVTALALRRPGSAMEQAAAAECARFIAHCDLRPFTRLRLPRLALYLPVPVVALLLLGWHARFLAAAAAHRPTPAELAAAADLNAAATASRDPSSRLGWAAGPLAATAQRLAHPTAPGPPGERLLRELANLEARLRDAADQASAPAATLAEALATALDAAPATQPAATALRQHDFAGAAAALAQLAAQPVLDDVAAAAVTRALALARPAAVAQAASGAPGPGTARGESGTAAAARGTAATVRDLAAVVGALAADQASGGTGRPAAGGGNDETALRDLLAALEDLRAGQPDSWRSLATAGPEADLAAAAPAAARAADRPTEGAAATVPARADNETGTVGGERDFGTTESPFGPRQKRVDALDNPVPLPPTGRPGESLGRLVAASRSDDRARREYGEIHRAAAARELAALPRERIPAASRDLVRRYFNAIRPPE